jgi:GTP-binding protein HflX
VGFLSDLPEDLVAAFRATLEELTDADLLLHVVDIADPRLEEKMKAVQKLLEELDLNEIPCLLVLNKADLLPPAEALALANRHRGVAVSATKRQGLRRLIAAAEDALHPKQPMLKEYGEVSEQPAASNS